MVTRRRDRQEPDEPEVRAWSIRTEVKPTTLALAFTTFLAWAGSLVLFTLFTDLGRAQFAERGLGYVGGWFVVSALVVAGYVAGYLLTRRFARGDKKFTEQGVLRLALGDAFLTACGGFLLGFLPLSITAEPFVMLTWVMVVGVLFGTAVLLPRYRSEWQRVHTDG